MEHLMKQKLNLMENKTTEISKNNSFIFCLHKYSLLHRISDNEQSPSLVKIESGHKLPDLSPDAEYYRKWFEPSVLVQLCKNNNKNKN